MLPIVNYKSPLKEIFPWTTKPLGLVEYIATLGKYVKVNVIRPEWGGKVGIPEWSTVMAQTPILSKFY